MYIPRFNISAPKPTGSSAGASLNDFTTQWSLTLCPPERVPTSATATAAWTTGSPIGQLTHELSVTFAGTECVPMESQGREFVYRAICHAMLDGLPVAALQEVAECIADSYNQHILKPWWRAALPAAQTPRLQGRLAPAKQRQPFHLGDE